MGLQVCGPSVRRQNRGGIPHKFEASLLHIVSSNQSGLFKKIKKTKTQTKQKGGVIFGFFKDSSPRLL